MLCTAALCVSSATVGSARCAVQHQLRRNEKRRICQQVRVCLSLPAYLSVSLSFFLFLSVYIAFMFVCARVSHSHVLALILTRHPPSTPPPPPYCYVNRFAYQTTTVDDTKSLLQKLALTNTGDGLGGRVVLDRSSDFTVSGMYQYKFTFPKYYKVRACVYICIQRAVFMCFTS